MSQKVHKVEYHYSVEQCSQTVLELSDEEITALAEQILSSNQAIGATALARKIVESKFTDVEAREKLENPMRQKLYRLGLVPNQKAPQVPLEKIKDTMYTIMETERTDGGTQKMVEARIGAPISYGSYLKCAKETGFQDGAFYRRAWPPFKRPDAKASSGDVSTVVGHLCCGR